MTTGHQENRAALHVLVVTEDARTAQLVERTLAGSPDQVGVANDLSEGLSKALAEVPDIVLVDLGLGNNAGLAVVHHLRALSTVIAIYALTGPEALELGPQAMALGASGVLVLPLSGDEIMRTVGSVRAERADRAERTHLQKLPLLRNARENSRTPLRIFLRRIHAAMLQNALRPCCRKQVRFTLSSTSRPVKAHANGCGLAGWAESSLPRVLRKKWTYSDGPRREDSRSCGWYFAGKAFA